MVKNFKNYFRDGVYIGPAMYMGGVLNSPPDDLDNLVMDGLLEVDSLFLPEHCSSVSLKNLRAVTGPLSLTGKAHIILDNLEDVGGTLYANNPNVLSIPKLKHIGGGTRVKRKRDGKILVGEHPIPYMPELDGETIIARKPHGGTYREDSYKDFAQLVDATPNLELVRLRGMKPYLAHLIDHRLKGGI